MKKKTKQITYFVLAVVFFALVTALFIYYPKTDKGVMVVPKTTYSNSSEQDILVSLPFPDAVTGKEFSVIGKARGTWFFEASFPVKVLDEKGKVLWQGPAQAQEDWMTEDFVPFEAQVKIPQSYMGKATLVLQKDNPSGLPEKDASISFPFNIEY